MTLEEKIKEAFVTLESEYSVEECCGHAVGGNTPEDEPQCCGQPDIYVRSDKALKAILSLLPNRERERVLQEFEKHPALAAYIERIANAPLGWPHADWCDFLNKLNEALLAEPKTGEREKALEEAAIEAEKKTDANIHDEAALADMKKRAGVE